MTSFWCMLTVFYCLVVTCWSRGSKLTRSRRTIVGHYPLCPLGCDSCSSSNGCITCTSGYYLYIERAGARQVGRCVQACPSGYHGLSKKDYGICRRCPVSHCERCPSAELCTSCRQPHVLHDNTCVQSCPPHLQHATLSNQCQTQVDCVQTPWSEWSVCKRNGQTCGYKYGSHTRTRHVMQKASPGGDKCQAAQELGRCRMLYRYCSDILTNSSEPRRHRCHVTRRERSRRRKGRDKKRRRMRKRCKHRRKHKKRTKSRHEKERRRDKSDKADRETSSVSSKMFNNVYYEIPNLKTNRIDRLLTAR